ncbi:YdcF family protein [Candidatus Falkowbacteria bacterium]|nr:YdcF family protein [Candidatus Falkowbacteria bacterium]
MSPSPETGFSPEEEVASQEQEKSEAIVPYREEKINQKLAQKNLETDIEKEKKPATYDAAIVFGFGALSEDRQKTPDEKKWRLSFAARLRLDAAASLYLMGEVNEVFVSEGGSNKYKENGQEIKLSGAKIMKNYLVEYWGLPEGIVKEEAHATNTLENFAHTINMLDKEKDQAEKSGTEYKYNNLAFISSGFHVPRIRELASTYGLKGETISAEEMIQTAMDEEKGVEGFEEKELDHARFEPELDKEGNLTGHKVIIPEQHDPKAKGFNRGEMQGRAYNPNDSAYQEWLQTEDKYVIPSLKQGWEVYYLQNIAIINPERLQKMIASNEKIQQFIDELSEANLDDPKKLAGLNIKEDMADELKKSQEELKSFFQDKKINTAKEIKNLNPEDMENFQQILQGINRLGSTLFKAPREKIEQEWRTHFESTSQTEQ